ncbi:transcription termination factor Rho [candidate division WOR-1 bacterium RIFOXYB2_FULL_42_35]|uniref:Transcription termination factor Rho n=1 Tax=candidate division WOR-1 bacterium RIFOXYC2_FULL_41_25 TaxID=1802586 RepID=A0A1F4TJ62_UNCSA|nr:MAG: transcription termination factor Rho [candidate division WOR-1 bacterium RIFOXYA2_FULL_41_14]OGC21572.1 MAG: transcription termination factor Rho [candidate division WOR-1 bacterium RIFOXYB2_FULL_42_35]OGC32550.1 MAG: transcription termination factor Rho [candidate division WOR-1 bacterium RIFOXYC2_FULL_41_25]OGC42222.1 MAG: transcription termination factor Rho [candidate division WOR-1 bacterium RIFOXYD2_FULL_41_8]
MDIVELEGKTLPQLYEIAKGLGIPGYRTLKKHDLVFRILEGQTKNNGNLFTKGVLEILPEGYGFLRTRGYLPSREDVYVSQTQIRRFDMQNGDLVSGQIRQPKEGEKYYSLLKIEAINNIDPEMARERVPFDILTPIFPDKRYDLEYTKCPIVARLIDLLAPIGMGQRAMVVSPPKAGKTTILKNVANSIAENFPETIIKVLLVDERPEEVTDMQRSVKGEVVGSTFDEPPENHIKIAELLLESCKRLVEAGKDVVILLDSITRLARAYNLVTPPSGRTLSGGLDPTCLHRPKRFFGAARNIEEGGSLTIVATALVDTGSRMDDIIYEEFKGTGNMELHLNRKLADKRIYPAIDIKLSGTRREELLLEDKALKKVWLLRKIMDSYETADGTEQLIERLKEFKSNKHFLETAEVK